MIMILFFTMRDRHSESQISKSAESKCFLIPSEDLKGFFILVESCTAQREELYQELLASGHS